MAFIVLLGNDPPSELGERIVTKLGGEHAAAEWFVQNHFGAGSIGSFGLTNTLIPSLEDLARNARRRRYRRRAAQYAAALTHHPAGWPMTDQ
jgi:hypothetical protein